MIDTPFLQKTARLACLKLEGHEVAPLREDLTRILSFIQDLRGVDTEGVSPLITPFAESTPLREDEPHLEETAQDALSNAPHTRDSYFLVPKFLRTT